MFRVGHKEDKLKLILKTLILLLSIMTGFLFLSGVGIYPEFFTFTPSAEVSKFVITISSLISFSLLSRRIIKLIFKNDDKIIGKTE